MKNVFAIKYLCHYRATSLIIILVLLTVVTCVSAEKASSYKEDPAIKSLIAKALAAEDAGNLGAMLAYMKQYDEAISTLTKLLTINPKNADARAMLADIELERKRKIVISLQIIKVNRSAFVI